jgi:hypothetical protein
MEVAKNTALDRGPQPLPVVWLQAGGLVELEFAGLVVKMGPKSLGRGQNPLAHG